MGQNQKILGYQSCATIEWIVASSKRGHAINRDAFIGGPLHIIADGEHNQLAGTLMPMKGRTEFNLDYTVMLSM